MSEEVKEFQTAPTLTLNPFAEEEKAQPEVKKEEPLMDENVLSEEERKMADQFANQIDLTNSAMILQYGAGTQSKMADFSETALENVKTKDLGEVGELLGNVVSILGIDTRLGVAHLVMCSALPQRGQLACNLRALIHLIEYILITIGDRCRSTHRKERTSRKVVRI